MNILEYENYQEIKAHYDAGFSYNTYLCTIPLDFFSVPIHWHNEMELIYVKKGRGIIRIDLTDYEISAGSIAIILPGHLHGISQLEHESLEYENIIFTVQMLLPKQSDSLTEDFFNSLLSHQLRIPILITPKLPLYESLINCINQADEICSHFPSGYYLGIRSCLYQFFFLLTSNLSQQPQQHKPSKSIEKIKLITKYVEEHFSDEITIEQMAKVCDFSQSHFMKFFKLSMGTSFFHYLNDYRLTTASNLLTKSSSSILAIAEECGYNNLSYFNRIFKQKYGMTPTSFRARQL